MALVAQAVAGREDVAAVEGADPQPLERPLHLLGQVLEAVVLDQHPKEVLVREALGRVAEALGGERLVDVSAVARVGVQALLALDCAPWQSSRCSSSAPRSAGPARRSGVERVGKLLVVLGDHASARAVGPIQLDQLDPEAVGDQGHRAVQLGGEAAADAAGPVRDLDRAAIRRPPWTASPSVTWEASSGSGSIAARARPPPPAPARPPRPPRP